MVRRMLPVLLGLVLVGGALTLAHLAPGKRRVVARAVPSSATLGRGAEVWMVLPRSAERTDITVERADPLGLVGRRFTRGEVLWGGWRVARVTPWELRLTPAPGGRPVFLGVRDGYVAVFLGPPRLGVVEEVTGIRENSLFQGDRRRLEQGVGVGSVGAALALIQGFPQ